MSEPALCQHSTLDIFCWNIEAQSNYMCAYLHLTEICMYLYLGILVQTLYTISDIRQISAELRNTEETKKGYDNNEEILCWKKHFCRLCFLVMTSGRKFSMEPTTLSLTVTLGPPMVCSSVMVVQTGLFQNKRINSKNIICIQTSLWGSSNILSDFEHCSSSSFLPHFDSELAALSPNTVIWCVRCITWP